MEWMSKSTFHWLQFNTRNWDGIYTRQNLLPHRVPLQINGMQCYESMPFQSIPSFTENDGLCSNNKFQHQFNIDIIRPPTFYHVYPPTSPAPSPPPPPPPFKKKLENCVYKTQVMPPCPKPVLTPCPILTHDPQHIQSILETNV